MTYAVVLRADDGPDEPGRLELERDAVLVPGGRSVRYSDLGDVYLERLAGAGGSRPTLVLVSRGGERLRISTVEGPGALRELAEELVEARGKAAA
ncbi:MAG TPA: hypothetical protein VFB42_11430 [Gaiellaceae bacterium]|nr:hypothetical protein [Gaiellaceae bacterium]